MNWKEMQRHRKDVVAVPGRRNSVTEGSEMKVGQESKWQQCVTADLCGAREQQGSASVQAFVQAQLMSRSL